MKYSVGSLVKTRGREWVVLPESDEQLLMLRPLGGTEDEATGIFLPLEKVEAAQFALPDITKPGDSRSSRLLRDAVRLGFRSSAGPFRSFARIAVEPRPYQLVPLLLALRQDPVRLLIADDVGVGKTIEAGLIARELLDRGDITRLAVLCPPQLVEQWQGELSDKFHIEAELVLPSTVSRLEKNTRLGQSLFEVYPFVIVSTDFIKSDRRREDFQRACPEFVIVDEAHTCAYGGEGQGGRHQRHQLISRLAANSNRHLVLVTATPHSGNDAAFRSLLGLLDKEFASLPDDLSRQEYLQQRQRLADHMVQRRRADIRHYLQADTPFPERLEKEESFKLSPEYKKLFEKVLKYARETVQEPESNLRRQRVRWWSVLALLRSLGSSPAAAASTLRNRANTAASETVEEVDELGRRSVLDIVDEQSGEGFDLVPGSDFEDDASQGTQNRRRLLEMAREADALAGAKDEKLKGALKLVKDLVSQGFNPIVFCRYIPTAEYVAQALRESLPKDVGVAAITGLLPPAEREERVLQLAESKRRVLVATDCLSEGINLQEHFSAVLHYDLSWNPTRHEQREGRVDRYGQPQKEVRVITYFGIDNQIDGIVLEVLIQKYKRIRKELGISVPVPVDTDKVIEAIFEGLVLRENTGKHISNDFMQLSFDFGDTFAAERKQRDKLYKEWERSAEREKRSRTIFAHGSIDQKVVQQELTAVQGAIGSGVEVERFVTEALKAYGAFVSSSRGSHEVTLSNEVPLVLRESLDNQTKFKARFELPLNEGELLLSRTHPLVEGLATYVMDTALDPLGEGVARRCGVIRTKQVKIGTTLLLLRFRYHIITRKLGIDYPLLAEDCQLVAFTGSPQTPVWLTDNSAEQLLEAVSDANVLPDQAANFLQRVIDQYENLKPYLEEVAQKRGEELLKAHQRVRSAAQIRGQQQRVEPQLPPDVLGIYIYLPTN